MTAPADAEEPAVTWRCYRCEKTFIHARFLTDHLIRLHGEGAER